MIDIAPLAGNLTVVVVTSCLYFAFAWLFFAARLFKNYDIQSKWPMIFFSTTFTISCSMFQLIIFEIIGVLDEEYDLLLTHTQFFASFAPLRAPSPHYPGLISS